MTRCEVIPLPDHQVAMQIDGKERVRWHFGPSYPRPFFYPLLGPSGQPLTRMGHPGAPNHDHHQSIWFAHSKVLGIDFWSNGSPARIRQQQWLVYEDGDEEAVLAVQLGWYDGHDPKELLQQELIAVLRPGEKGESFLELQSTFRPIADSLELGQTNFGFLAVRVAKGLAEHFGGGKLTNSDGLEGEPAIFGRPARWMDYSGTIAADRNGERVPLVEGITYFDHARNPRYPATWHVREDGWMGAALCLAEPIVTTRQQPLVLRYLLHAHSGPADRQRSDAAARQFNERPAYAVRKSTKKHQQYELVRG